MKVKSTDTFTKGVDAFNNSFNLGDPYDSSTNKNMISEGICWKDMETCKVKCSSL